MRRCEVNTVHLLSSPINVEGLAPEPSLVEARRRTLHSLLADHQGLVITLGDLCQISSRTRQGGRGKTTTTADVQACIVVREKCGNGMKRVTTGTPLLELHV